MAFISTGTSMVIQVSGSTNDEVTVNLLSFNVNVSRPTVETSTMATPFDHETNASNIHSATFLPGKMVTRTLEATFDYDPTQQASAGTLALLNYTDTSVVLLFSTSPTDAWSASGQLTDYSSSAGVDERVEGSMSIQLSGVPTAGW